MTHGTGGFSFDLRRSKTPSDNPWPDLRGTQYRTTVTPGEYPVSLRWALRTIKHGTKTFLELLRMYAMSDHDKSGGDAQRLVDTIDEELKKPTGRGQRITIDLDAICHSLRISPAAAFGWFSEASFEHGANLARMQAAVRAPAVTQASIERALNVDEGYDDRKLLFEALGLTKGNGRSVAVQTNVFPPPDASSATTVTEQTFEDQQRNAAALLRAPLKQVGSGSAAPAGEDRVRPLDRQPTPRTDR